jgi:hypothetical protein
MLPMRLAELVDVEARVAGVVLGVDLLDAADMQARPEQNPYGRCLRALCDPDRRRKLASAFPEIDAIVTEAVTRAKQPGGAVGAARRSRARTTPPQPTPTGGIATPTAFRRPSTNPPHAPLDVTSEPRRRLDAPETCTISVSWRV